MAMYQDASGNWRSGEGDGKQYNYTNVNGQYVDNSGSAPVYSTPKSTAGGGATPLYGPPVGYTGPIENNGGTMGAYDNGIWFPSIEARADYRKTGIYPGYSASSPPPTPPAATNAQPQTPNVSYPNMPSQSNTAYPQMTPEQIKAEAQAKVDKLLADRTRVADQTKQGFQTQFDRANALTQDNRTLQSVQLKRNLNPFSGQSQEQQDMVQRQWSIDDANSKQDLATRMANVDMDLADYANATDAQREAMVNEMTARERAYGLQLDQLALQKQQQYYNQFNQDRTFDYNSGRDAVSDARYTDTTGYNRGRDAVSDAKYAEELAYKKQQDKVAADRQSRIDNWNAYMQSVGLTGNLGTGAKADWNLLGGTDGEPTFQAKSTYLQQEGQKLNNELAQLQLENYPQEQKLKIQQLQKQIDQIGKAPYQSAVDAEYDKIKLDTAKEQLAQLKNKPNETKQQPLTSYTSSLNQRFLDRDNQVTDQKGLELAILNLPVDNQTKSALYNYYGIPMQ